MHDDLVMMSSVYVFVWCTLMMIIACSYVLHSFFPSFVYTKLIKCKNVFFFMRLVYLGILDFAIATLHSKL